MQQFKHHLSCLNADNLIFIFLSLTFFLLPTGTAPPLIAVGLASLVWLFSGKALHIKSIIKQSWFFPVIPFLLLPWIGLLYSQNLDLGMDYALKTKYWIAIFITAGIVIDQKRVDLLLKCFWAGLLSGAFLAFIQIAGLMPPIKGGMPGFGIVHSFISPYLVIGILTVSFYYKNSSSRIFRSVLIFLFLAFLFHLTVLRGKSGYLIFVLVSPFIANNFMHKFSLQIKIVVSVILGCIIFVSPVVRDVVKNIFIQGYEQKERILKGEDIKKMPRPFMIRESIKIISAHPFIGIGTGSLSVPTKAKGHTVNHPHNNFLYMWVSYGLFGLVACFWLFWRIFQLSWHSRNTALGFFIFFTSLVLFISGMFDTQILNTGPLLLLSLTYGMLNHLRNPAICDNMEKLE